MEKIKVYTAMRMTGRLCSEIYVEAQMLTRVLNNYGFVVLNPAVDEGIKNEHTVLENVPKAVLEKFWFRDKMMIKEADILIDYMTMNKSDGSNKEVAYNRFCLWKPTIRVWDGNGGLISRIEDDIVVPTLREAVNLALDKWGTYDKLGAWRKEMLSNSFPKWLKYQQGLIERYGLDSDLLGDILDMAPELGGY